MKTKGEIYHELKVLRSTKQKEEKKKRKKLIKNGLYSNNLKGFWKEG